MITTVKDANKISVFVADDMEHNMAAVKYYISRMANYKVVGSDKESSDLDVRNVCYHICKNNTKIALLAVNNMPGLDGIAIAKEVHKVNPYMKIILMTNKLTCYQMQKARKAGVTGFIRKDRDSSNYEMAMGIVLQNGGEYCDPFFKNSCESPDALSEWLRGIKKNILLLSANRLPVKTIAHILNRTESDINHHRKEIKEKFGIEDRNFQKAVDFALNNGFITMEEANEYYASHFPDDLERR